MPHVILYALYCGKRERKICNSTPFPTINVEYTNIKTNARLILSLYVLFYQFYNIYLPSIYINILSISGVKISWPSINKHLNCTLVYTRFLLRYI